MFFFKIVRHLWVYLSIKLNIFFSLYRLLEHIGFNSDIIEFLHFGILGNFWIQQLRGELEETEKDYEMGNTYGYSLYCIYLFYHSYENCFR